MCALSAPFLAPGVATLSVPMLPFIAGQASIDPNVPPIGVGSPRRAAISKVPSVNPNTRRKEVPLHPKFAQHTTLPAAPLLCLRLRDNARPEHSQAALGARDTTTLLQ